MKKITKMQSLLFILIMIVLIVAGCGVNGYKVPPMVTSYTASGTILNESGNPVPNVTIEFTGDGKFASVTTGADGTWSASGLYNSVTVKPVLTNQTFNPLSQVITGESSSVNFTLTKALYHASGRIINKGNSQDNGMAGVILSYEYPAGTPHSVQTDTNGNWTISEELEGTIHITLTAPIGMIWQFFPSGFDVTYESSQTTNGNDVIGTDKFYTGQQIVDALVANTTIRSTTAATVMPASITIAGETVNVASMVYLMAKFITLYTDGSPKDGNAGNYGTKPASVPYLEINKPSSATLSGKTEGNIWFGGPTWGYYAGCVSLASELETTLQIPSRNIFTGWNSTNSSSNPTYTVFLSVADVINCLARAVYYTNANPRLSNYFGPYGMTKPSGW